MRIILIIIIVIALASCYQLDDLAFPSDNTITSYQLDNYTGETDMVLPDSLKIAQDKITLLTLDSKSETESEPVKIAALYIGDLSRIKTDTIIVYCHGQADHIDFYWPRAKLLANVGGKNHYGVLMMDYRGYGLSKGEPTEEGMFADVIASLRWLKEKGVSNSRTIMYGFSLGTVPATELAARFSEFLPSKLILESPMASTNNLTQESSLINVSATFITTLKFNNAETIKEVKQPFLWMHGTADDYLAITNGEIIYTNYCGIYKEAHRVEGAKHGANGVPQTLGWSAYFKIVDDFIKLRD